MNFSKTILFLASIAPAVFAQYKVVLNPYEGVDWGTYGKYKAAFHVHTTSSDGDDNASDMLKTHYLRDFSIVAVTDHGVLTESWSEEPKRAATDKEFLAFYSSKPKKYLTKQEENQIINGEYDRIDPDNITNRTQPGGMIGLKCGIELLANAEMYTSSDTHIDIGHSFTAGACNLSYSSKDSITKVLKLSAAAGGVNYIHHPGRYTGGGYADDSAAGAAISNNRIYIDKYVKLLKETSALGMEIMNKRDYESKSDRVLYDNILKVLAPDKRPVWAFSSDDSHNIDEVGWSFNVMLLPELSETATIESMKKGAFYAVARVDRRECINHKFLGQDTPERKATPEAAKNFLPQSVPSISKIAVDKERGIITITGDDYTTIEWIADGVKIATGNTLDMNRQEYEGKIFHYVRAQLKSTTGIAYTQPFYVQNPNFKIDPWYTIPTGLTALEEDKLSSVLLPAGWAWVDGNQAVEYGSQTYKAIFTPSDPMVYNTVTEDVSVMGKPAHLNMYEISKTGDYYYYLGRTNAQFLTDAFDMSALNGWTNAPTSIGFGTTPTPKTTIPSASRYAWTYFKKQFTINNKNFKISEIMSVSGRHQIDDAMIMYINGIEVYRYNTNGSSTEIDATVNWNSYAGNATTVQTAAQMDFTINSDYKNGTTRDAASLTNFKKAIKPGINIITCVVGNQSSGSSDLFFDLQMNITVNEKNPQPFTDISGASLKPATYTFTGSAQKPVLILGTKDLVEGVDYAAKYTNNINAGSADNAAIVEITGMGDYIGNKGLSFIINKANQPDLSITPVTGKKFGDAAFNLSAAGGNANGMVTYELVSGPGTVTSAGRVSITGAGNIVIRATKTSNENFNPVSAETTIKVDKASLTLVAENKTVSVGDPAPTYTYTVSGLVGSDTKESIITTQPSISAAAFSSSVANKTFDITISGGATTSPNYEIKTYTNGKLTIKDKTPVSISGLTAQNGTYNGSSHIGYTGTPTFTGGTPTTALTASYTGRNSTTYSSTSTAPTNAGDYTVKLTLDDDPGYSGTVSINFTIGKASLTLKADNKTISVGDIAPTTYTYTVSGLIGSDTKDIITTQPTLSVANFSSSVAKTFDITISGGATTSPNYEIKTYAKGTLTVANKTTVAITGLTAQSGPYNGQPRVGYSGTPTFTGGTPTTPLTASYTGRSGTTYSSPATAPTNAGDYTVKLSLDNDPAFKGEVSFNFAINKASLTLIADDKTISMGDPVPIYTYTVSGLVNPDTKESIITTQPILSVANFSSLAANTFDITISGGETTSQNYTIGARTDGKLTVNSAIQDSVSSSITPISPRLQKIPSSNRIAQIKNGMDLMVTNRAVVEIYGLKGNLIQRQSFKSGVYSILLEHLPRGIYIAKASFGSETKILRIVVR